MKKFLAIMLAMVMVLSLLAGCGDKSSKKNSKKDDDDDDDKKETTSQTDGTKGTEGTAAAGGNNDSQSEKPSIEVRPTEEVAVGVELDAPEKSFPGRAYRIKFVMINAGQTMDAEVIVKEAANGSGTYYMAQGENAIVIEATQDNSYFGYAKEGGNTEFEPLSDADQATLQGSLETIKQLASMFTNCTEAFDEARFRKAEPTVTCATGPVFAYDVIIDGEDVGLICVDKATGIVVYIADDTTGGTITVSEFQISSVEFPSYK